MPTESMVFMNVTMFIMYVLGYLALSGKRDVIVVFTVI